MVARVAFLPFVAMGAGGKREENVSEEGVVKGGFML